MFRAAVLSFVVVALVLNPSAGLLCKPMCDGMAARQTKLVACHHADETPYPRLVAESKCNDLALGDAVIIKDDERPRLSTASAGQYVMFPGVDLAGARRVSLRSALERTFETRPSLTPLRI